ncbi:hypothetical protein BDF14DRAFT_1721673 [Spinellus fusiger]|nr:hypothetical protein BDF14DRAFT_1721673 [Spinellus fusiger]
MSNQQNPHDARNVSINNGEEGSYHREQAYASYAPNNAPNNPSGAPYYDPRISTEYSSKRDPYIEKMTSNLWCKAGQLQSMVGSWVGHQEWETSGHHTQSWAQDNYQEAELRLQANEPSWTHGEYDRWMGKLEAAVGHVTGDPEMEAKALMRTRQGTEEVEKASEL